MKVIRVILAVACATAGLAVAPSAQAASELETFTANSSQDVRQLMQQACITRRSGLDGSSPIFYGCFDWHSAVHGNWSHYAASELTGDSSYLDAVNANMPARKFSSEASYMRGKPMTRRSDNTYGFAWLLKLNVDRERVTGQTDFRSVADQAAEALAGKFGTLRPLDSEYANGSWSAMRLHEYAKLTGNSGLESQAAEYVSGTLKAAECPVSQPKIGGFFEPCWMRLAAIAQVEGASAASYLRDQTAGVRFSFWPNSDTSHTNAINFYTAYAMAKVAAVTKDPALLENAASLINQQMASRSGWSGDYTKSHWVPQTGVLAIQALREATQASSTTTTPSAQPTATPTSAQPVATRTPTPVVSVEPTVRPSERPAPTRPAPSPTTSSDVGEVDDEHEDTVALPAPEPVKPPAPAPRRDRFRQWWWDTFGWGW